MFIHTRAGLRLDIVIEVPDDTPPGQALADLLHLEPVNQTLAQRLTLCELQVCAVHSE